MTEERQEKCEILNVQAWYEKIQGTFLKGLWQDSSELVTNQLGKCIMEIDSSLEGSQEEIMQLGAAHRPMCSTVEVDPKVPRISGHVQVVPKVHCASWKYTFMQQCTNYLCIGLFPYARRILKKAILSLISISPCD